MMVVAAVLSRLFGGLSCAILSRLFRVVMMVAVVVAVAMLS